jgi:GT2 family glycosyltransferase
MSPERAARRTPAFSPLAPGKRRCTLVITNFNGLDNLRAYLPLNLLVVESSPECDEVIVVDDGSDDGSVAYLWKTFPKVKVIPLFENRGFGNAANSGFRAAKNDYVVNISNDMVLTGYFFEYLFDNMVLDDVFHVSARLVGPDGRIQKGRTIPFFVGDFKIWKAFAREPAVASGRPACLYNHFCGAIGLFDRRKFLELDGFDDMYLPFYVEETDLCYRAWKRGYRVLYEPRSWLIHHHRESGTIVRKFAWSVRKVQYRKNRLLFMWKNLAHPGYILLHLVFVAVQLCFSWLAGHAVFYRGFREALALWPEVMRKRREEKPHWVRSDAQVFREFAREIVLPAADRTLPAPAGDAEPRRLPPQSGEG